MPHVEDRPKDTSEGKSWVYFCKEHASGSTDYYLITGNGNE